MFTKLSAWLQPPKKVMSFKQKKTVTFAILKKRQRCVLFEWVEKKVCLFFMFDIFLLCEYAFLSIWFSLLKWKKIKQLLIRIDYSCNDNLKKNILTLARQKCCLSKRTHFSFLFIFKTLNHFFLYTISLYSELIALVSAVWLSIELKIVSIYKINRLVCSENCHFD